MPTTEERRLLFDGSFQFLLHESPEFYKDEVDRVGLVAVVDRGIEC